MNNRGQATYIYAFMLAVVFFWLGLALASPVSLVVTESVSGLDCTNSSIAHENKVVCVTTDMFAPLVVALCFGAGGYLLGRGFL